MTDAQPVAAIPARCDVAVVGAGPAGAATAHQLAARGCHVVLLERSSFSCARVGESLAPAVQPLLGALGVWPQFLALGPVPSYGTRSVWGDDELREHSHLSSPYLRGWHVDRVAFDRMLALAAQRVGATLVLGARVVRCAADLGSGWTLEIAQSARCAPVSCLRAQCVVDATGRGSTLARWLGARHAVFDRLVGIGAQQVGLATAWHGYTLVEATPDGWWYSAPIPQGRAITMLMTDGDLARARGLQRPPGWRAALRAAPLTQARMGKSAGSTEIRTHSAVSQRLLRTQEYARSWLAVGDAALSIDPISGGGVVAALRSATAAARALESCSERASAIRAYDAERDAECTRYLIERAQYYGAERRWPDAPFWQRRIRALGAGAPT